MSGLRRLFLLFFTLAPALGAALPAAAAGLVAHRAEYAMSLATTTRGGNVVGARGSMTYRLQRQCDGWTVENHTELILHTTDDRRVESVYDYAAWESADGRRLRFRATHSRDGTITERVRGTATLDGADGGSVRFTAPEKDRRDLPSGTVFPVEHTRVIMEGARAGKKLVSVPLFDGAEKEALFQVTAAIGERVADAKSTALADPPAALTDNPAWPVHLAFHGMGPNAPATPEFEVSARLHANGIAGFLRQDYGKFALNGRLQTLDLLPPPDC